MGVPFHPVPHHVRLSPRSVDTPHQGPTFQAIFGCFGTGPTPWNDLVQFPRKVVNAGYSGSIGEEIGSKDGVGPGLGA